MAKPLQQNDDGTVSDPVTTETQKGYANYEADLAKKQARFKDEKPIGQKIGDAIGSVLMPLSSGIAKMGGSEQIEAKRLHREQQKMQKQYEEQDKQEGRKMKKGGSVKSASARADGCAIRGKTRA
jgi:hypothetical protein